MNLTRERGEPVLNRTREVEEAEEAERGKTQEEGRSLLFSSKHIVLVWVVG